METSRPSRPAYPPEFRARAVELARASALPPSQVARDLGVDPDWSCLTSVSAGESYGNSLGALVRVTWYAEGSSL